MHKKIAFVGSVGSGKTTIIEHLSQISAFNTDVESTADIGKEMTTVGIDYGQINIDQNTSVGLYGVPGQRKFSLIWDFVKEGLWAIVILIKNNSKQSIDELEYLLDYFDVHAYSKCLIGITHADISQGEATYNKVQDILSKHQFVFPVYTLDSRLKKSSELIMQTLIAIEETSHEP